jgi:hypothetical protein
VIVRV